MSAAGSVDEAFAALTAKGGASYGETGIDQMAHALQSAQQAERAGASDAMVAAALLHDIGHMIDPEGESAFVSGDDRAHENLGAQWLSGLYGEDVTEPVRLHVPAKRWLVWSKDGYQDRLSAASVRTLEMQGGAFASAEEAQAFEAEPFFKDAVRLRVWDDAAKVPGAQTPPLAHYRAACERASRG